MAIARRATSAQLTLSWASPLDRFTVSQVRIVRHGKVVARAARRRRLKIRTRKGSTFTVVKVSHLVKCTLRFRVKATRIRSAHHRVTLTTQVSQTRRR